jgi:hypothetical protein
VTRVRAFLAPPVPVARVAVLRVVVYVFTVVHIRFIANDPVPHGDVPAELYQPVLLREWLQVPAPSPLYVRVLEVVLVASALVAATGRLPRVSGAVCLVAFLDWQTNNFGYGKVDHDSFAILVALAVLPTVGPASWRDSRVSERAGWAIRMVQLGVVASYFLAALAKLRFGGLLWANGAVFTWAFSRRGTDVAESISSVPGLLRAGQWTVLLAELASPLMLWLRGRWVWFAVLFWAGFHLVTYLAIGIHFLALAVCLLAFLPLERLVPRPTSVLRSPLRRGRNGTLAYRGRRQG